MDYHSIYQLFTATYHSDPNIQKQAELQLKRVEGIPGFISTCLQIIGSQESETGTRQAAAIYLKNRIRNSWDMDEENKKAVPISDDDRRGVKQNILNVLLNTPNNVRIQLLDCLNRVLARDHPKNWPDYLSQVQMMLTSNDPSTVYIGCLALLEVVKIYQWKSEEFRGPLREIIRTAFPVILQVALRIQNEDSLDAAELMRIILKTYSSAVHYELVKDLQDNSSLVHWGTLFLNIVAKPSPESTLPADPAEREKFGWMRPKKWAYNILNRLFSRYGNPAQLPRSAWDLYKIFAENFIENFAPQILRQYLHQTELWIKKEQWLSKRALFSLADFYKDAIFHKKTWQILKPYSGELVSHFIFPQLCFTTEDNELWLEDPIEYIHKKVDPLEDFTSPVNAATTFLMELTRHRRKHVLNGILGFINSILKTYQEAPSNEKKPGEKDGALRMMGCLADQILRKKSSVAHLMEGVFVEHVFPEFKSQHPFLRARACDMLVKFSELNFQDQQNLAAAFQGITDCMRDTELPVKVQAALALQSMIRHDVELINLTNQADIDILTTVMEEFVEVFSKELSPFAIQLCEQLRDAYLRIVQSIPEDREEEFLNSLSIDDKTMAANGVLKTLSGMIVNLEISPETFAQMEVTLLPVITYTLQNNIVDLYDDVFEIIDYCTFTTKKVSPAMWTVFDLVYNSVKDAGIDYIEDIVPSLDNYISYGKDVLLENQNIQAMMMDIIDTIMKHDRLEEKDRVAGCKLMESVLLNCRGQVDQYVRPFMDLAFMYFAKVQEVRSTAFKLYLLEVIINALYYNPLHTLVILEEYQTTQAFFTIWFQSLDTFNRVHDKKLTIVALCALVELPPEQLPQAVQVGWSQILQALLTILKGLPKAEQNRERIRKIYEEGIDSDDDESQRFRAFGGDEEADDDFATENADDEDVLDQDTEYLEMLAQEAARAAAEETDDDEDDIKEEVVFESPLDDIDVYIKFQETLVGLQQRNPLSYQLLTRDLTSEDQEVIKSLFATADEHREHAKTVATKENGDI